MRHRSTEALFRYWERMRGDRPAPRRTEIDPRAIARALGDVFLLEGPAEDFRFRLAGSRIVEALGRSVTGLPYEEIWSIRARLAAMSALWSVAEEHEPMLIGIRIDPQFTTGDAFANARAGQRPGHAGSRASASAIDPERRRPQAMAGEMLLLPLAQQRGIGARLIGVLALFEHPAFSTATERSLDLTGGRMLGRAARPGRGTGLLPANLAGTVIGRRGHLVVMRGFKDTE